MSDNHLATEIGAAANLAFVATADLLTGQIACPETLTLTGGP